MANWHVDLYGQTKTDSEAASAIKAITDAAKGFGLTGGTAAASGLNGVDVTAKGLPAKAKPKAAPELERTEEAETEPEPTPNRRLDK